MYHCYFCSLLCSPVAAAIAAHSFVASALSEMPKKTEDSKEFQSLQEDVKIIGSSLYFVDDFLRSMLDIHASTANKLEIHLAPTDLLKDVLEPVQSILYQRDGHVDVTVECAESLIIMTDCLRLKQVSSVVKRESSRQTTLFNLTLFAGTSKGDDESWTKQYKVYGQWLCSVPRSRCGRFC